MPVIIISGMPVTGSSSTAKMLSRKLGLRHFSAGDYFKSFSSAEGETEKATTFMKEKKGKSREFHEALEEKIQQECEKGNVVIDTKLGIRMQKGNYDFSVWLKAPFSVRVKRVMERDNIGKEEASSLLKEKETLERKTWKRIYSFDYFSQEQEADMVIDNSSLSKEEVVQKILDEIKDKGMI